jgi:hypothetical protein
VKANRNESYLANHSNRFRNVGLYKGRLTDLLQKPTGIYALDYTPPGRRTKPSAKASEAQTPQPKEAPQPEPEEPIRLKDFDRTPDPYRTRLDLVRNMKLFDKAEFESYKFSDAARLVPLIIEPIREARARRPSIMAGLETSYRPT